ncbi:MAG: GNAT family N-acetyltransferase [Candidatus Heimdallarchaeota archaeon]|nr:GNAT family N-acetyltransferase [Candidatus Heimdallarchaeota archaeon]MBY8993162.1 GNAT family N-acetyltransferase [Candidatus Heimdallarchaeota archaeon]
MSQATIKIEGAKASDLEEVYALLGLVNLPIEGVEESIDHFLLLIREIDTKEEIIGCVGLEKYEQYALLRSAVVHPDHQGKSYGKQLTLAIVAYAKLIGIEQLFLLTDTAEKFFEKMGFRKIERSEVPAIVKTSIEFVSLCDESSTVMTLKT